MPFTREQLKQYREKNKEKIAEVRKQYRENNKEKIAEIKRQYQQTPMGKRRNRISSWKYLGIKLPEEYPDWDIFHDEEYLSTTNCEECGVLLTEDKSPTPTRKCLDHDHTTGLFRNILCNACNIQRG
tara:strand:- start:376 stop:756 length:381 start_codon:yes stop_codon:yes gene_type:complete